MTDFSFWVALTPTCGVGLYLLVRYILCQMEYRRLKQRLNGPKLN